MKEEISRENFIKHLNEWGYNFTVKKEKIIQENSYIGYM